MLRAMAESSAKGEIVVAAAGALVLAAGVVMGALHAPHAVAMAVRWVGVLLLMVYAWRRKSLTPWIFVAMVAGAELGFDAPHIARPIPPPGP